MERKCVLQNDVLVSLFQVLFDFTNALKIVLVLVESSFQSYLLCKISEISRS